MHRHHEMDKMAYHARENLHVDSKMVVADMGLGDFPF